MRAKFLLVLMVPAFAIAWPAFADEPLPKGATARFGTARFRDPAGWASGTLSADGQFFILQSARGMQKLSLATGEASGTIGDRAIGFGRSTRFTPDGTRAITLGYSDVTVWDVASGKTLASVKKPLPFGDHSGALSADGKVLAAGANHNFDAKDKPLAAIVWDVEKNEKIIEIPAAQNQWVNVALSPDGKKLATWGRHTEKVIPKEGINPATDPNRLLQIWDASNGKELSKLRTDGYGEPSLVFAPDGKTFALAAGTGTIRIIDAATGEEKRRFFGRNYQGVRLAYSPDGKTLASGASDGSVQLWNMADGTRGASIECPIGNLLIGLRGIQYVAADKAIAWTSVGLTAFAWEIPSGKLLTPVAGHVSFVQSVVFEDGGGLLTSGDDGQILRWSADGKSSTDVPVKAPGTSNSARFPMAKMSLTADGKIAMGQYSLSGVYDVATGRQIASPLSALSAESRPFLAADGRTVVVVPFMPYPPAPMPKTFKMAVWDIQTGARLAELETPPCDLVHAALSPDRTKLATYTMTRTDAKTEYQIAGWDLRTGAKLGEHKEASGFSNTYMSVSPDNATVVASLPNSKVAIVSLADGKILKELDTLRRSLTTHPVFSPDGKQVALAVGGGFGASTIGEIMIFDWESGKAVGKFRGHTGSITSIAFSKDGKQLATGGADTTALVWDLAQLEK